MGDFLRHLFIPHHTNNHRARALHVDTLFVFVLALMLVYVGLGWVHSAYPDILGYATDIRVEQLLDMINAKRKESGFTPLSLNAKLSQAAQAKANDMFSKGYWAHNSPDGKTPWNFIVDAGYTYVVAGENLAKNFNTSAGVVDAWMASSTHRDNILKSNYKDIGFAVVNGVLSGEETTLVVQMFGSGTGGIASAPLVTPAPQPAQGVSRPQAVPSPVVISQVASATVRGEGASVPSRAVFLTSVLTRPALDFVATTRAVAYTVLGFFVGMFVLDIWVMRRRHTVRISGHSAAHVLFLVALLLGIGTIVRGGIL